MTDRSAWASCAAGLSLVVALMAGSSAHAAQRLGPVTALSDGPGAPSFPVAAANERGDAVVAWENEIGAGWKVEVARSQNGGTFAKPLRLNARGQTARDPQVIVAPDGKVVVAWSQRRRVKGGIGTYTVLRLAQPGAPFGPPITLLEAGADETGVAVEFDPLGRLFVAWPERSSRGSGLRVKVFSPQGRPLLERSLHRDRKTSPSYAPAIAFDPLGGATFVWDQDGYDPDDRFVKAHGAKRPKRRIANQIKSRRMSPTGRLGGVRRLSPAGYDCGDFSADSRASGASAVSFTCHRGDPFYVYAVQRAPGQTFTRPRRVSGPDDYGSDIAVADDGQATLTWLRRRKKRYTSLGATFAGGRVAERFTLGRTGSTPPRAVGLGDGSSLLSLQRRSDDPRLAIRPVGGPAGPWFAFAPISGSGFALAPASPSRVLIAWLDDAVEPNLVRTRWLLRP